MNILNAKNWSSNFIMACFIMWITLQEHVCCSMTLQTNHSLKKIDVNARKIWNKNADQKTNNKENYFFHFLTWKRNRTKRSANRSKRKRNIKNRGCHLVGIEQPLSNKSYFVWAVPQRNAQLSTCFFPTKTETESLVRNIVIPKNGFYLVYAQVTFCTFGGSNTGFETGVYESSGESYNTLLRTAIKQDQVNATQCIQDSEYHSGYFYLEQRQYLEVRQIVSNVRAFSFTKQTAYFGIILMDEE